MYYVEILKEELRLRREKNNRYSLRAFARDLHLDPAVLCKVVQGKLIPSARLGTRLSNSLCLSDSQHRAFLRSMSNAKVESKLGAKPVTTILPGSFDATTIAVDESKVAIAQSLLAEFSEALKATLGETGPNSTHEIKLSILPLRKH